MATTRRACSSWLTRWRWASLVMAWRRASSKAPAVSSPPWRWTIGTTRSASPRARPRPSRGGRRRGRVRRPASSASGADRSSAPPPAASAGGSRRDSASQASSASGVNPSSRITVDRVAVPAATGACRPPTGELEVRGDADREQVLCRIPQSWRPVVRTAIAAAVLTRQWPSEALEVGAPGPWRRPSTARASHGRSRRAATAAEARPGRRTTMSASPTVAPAGSGGGPVQAPAGHRARSPAPPATGTFSPVPVPPPSPRGCRRPSRRSRRAPGTPLVRARQLRSSVRCFSIRLGAERDGRECESDAGRVIGPAGRHAEGRPQRYRWPAGSRLRGAPGRRTRNGAGRRAGRRRLRSSRARRDLEHVAMPVETNSGRAFRARSARNGRWSARRSPP